MTMEIGVEYFHHYLEVWKQNFNNKNRSDQAVGLIKDLIYREVRDGAHKGPASKLTSK